MTTPPEAHTRPPRRSRKRTPTRLTASQRGAVGWDMSRGIAVPPVYLGIDPGQAGAIAMLAGPLLDVRDVPRNDDGTYNEAGMLELLRRAIDVAEGSRIFATLERVAIGHHVPGMMAGGVQKGIGEGLWRGLLRGAAIPYELAAAQSWRKVFGLTGDKSASVKRAGELFPLLEAELTGPRGGLRDGRAEALLIAEYGRTVVWRGR